MASRAPGEEVPLMWSVRNEEGEEIEKCDESCDERLPPGTVRPPTYAQADLPEPYNNPSIYDVILLPATDQGAGPPGTTVESRTLVVHKRTPPKPVRKESRRAALGSEKPPAFPPLLGEGGGVPPEITPRAVREGRVQEPGLAPGAAPETREFELGEASAPAVGNGRCGCCVCSGVESCVQACGLYRPFEGEPTCCGARVRFQAPYTPCAWCIYRCCNPTQANPARAECFACGAAALTAGLLLTTVGATGAFGPSVTSVAWPVGLACLLSWGCCCSANPEYVRKAVDKRAVQPVLTAPQVQGPLER